MISWWDWPIQIILVLPVSCLNYFESLLDLVQHTAIPHPLDRTTLAIIFIHFFPFSILVISSFTSPVYRDQDSIILVFPIHDFSKCMTGIFSIFTGDYVIHDSGILVTYFPSVLLSKINLPYSNIIQFHNLQPLQQGKKNHIHTITLT